MKRKIDSDLGRYRYSRRLGIVEPVFANIRSTHGLDRFSHRGRRLSDGTIRLAELHWYEATGIGRKEFKLKRYLD